VYHHKDLAKILLDVCHLNCYLLVKIGIITDYANAHLFKSFLNMKKILLSIILAVALLSFKKLEKNGSKEKLTETELKSIKENYNWISKEFLIINFRMPKSSCHYNNYSDLKKSSTWWTSYYAKMKLVNVHNVFVYSDNKKAKKIIDSKAHFEDVNSFILNNFFSKSEACYGIVVVNENGEFKKKAGEYTQENILELINSLK